MLYTIAQLIFLCIFHHEWWNAKLCAVRVSASSETYQGGGNISFHPERRHGECLVQRKSFYCDSPRIYVAKEIKIFLKEVYAGFFIFMVLAFEDIHSPTIIYWDWGYRIKLEEKTWVLSVFYSKYIPSASIERVARSSKDWNDLCTSSCGMARRLDVTAPWMCWTSSKRCPFNGNFSLGNRK